jgi:hypothetical protein
MRGLILALAVAAIIPPVAQARIDSERSVVVQPATAAYSPQALKALVQRSEALNQKYNLGQTQLQNADPQTSTTVRHADDRAGIRGPGITQAAQLASSSSDGFNWGDASLGAGAALVAAIVLTCGVLLSRRHRTREAAV